MRPASPLEKLPCIGHNSAAMNPTENKKSIKLETGGFPHQPRTSLGMNMAIQCKNSGGDAIPNSDTGTQRPPEKGRQRAASSPTISGLAREWGRPCQLPAWSMA